MASAGNREDEDIDAAMRLLVAKMVLWDLKGSQAACMDHSAGLAAEGVEAKTRDPFQGAGVMLWQEEESDAAESFPSMLDLSDNVRGELRSGVVRCSGYIYVSLCLHL